MYDVDANRTATVQYTPRQWARILLDPYAWTLSQPLIQYVLIQLPISEHYPGDRIAVAATPSEAAMIAAQMRDFETRGY